MEGPKLLLLSSNVGGIGQAFGKSFQRRPILGLSSVVVGSQGRKVRDFIQRFGKLIGHAVVIDINIEIVLRITWRERRLECRACLDRDAQKYHETEGCQTN